MNMQGQIEAESELKPVVPGSEFRDMKAGYGDYWVDFDIFDFFEGSQRAWSRNECQYKRGAAGGRLRRKRGSFPMRCRGWLWGYNS